MENEQAETDDLGRPVLVQTQFTWVKTGKLLNEYINSKAMPAQESEGLIVAIEDS